MSKPIYEQSGSFYMLDYSPSHSQLVLRSKKNGERDYNVDILFKGVSAVLIATDIEGASISVLDADQERSSLVENWGFTTEFGQTVFAIADDSGRRFYVNAFAFGVYHNRLDILETIIGRYDMDDHGERVIWYAG